MDKKTKKEFLEFLKKNKVRVKGESVHVDDLQKAHELIHKFSIHQAKKSGLPKKLIPHINKVVQIEIDQIERLGQKPEEYGVEIVDSHKNYETGTWGGTFEGKVQDIYNWVLDECDHLDIDFIVDDLKEIAEEEVG